jgi:hypothetical protein
MLGVQNGFCFPSSSCQMWKSYVQFSTVGCKCMWQFTGHQKMVSSSIFISLIEYRIENLCYKHQKYVLLKTGSPPRVTWCPTDFPKKQSFKPSKVVKNTCNLNIHWGSRGGSLASSRAAWDLWKDRVSKNIKTKTNQTEPKQSGTHLPSCNSKKLMYH